MAASWWVSAMSASLVLLCSVVSAQAPDHIISNIPKRGASRLNDTEIYCGSEEPEVTLTASMGLPHHLLTWTLGGENFVLPEDIVDVFEDGYLLASISNNGNAGTIAFQPLLKMPAVYTVRIRSQGDDEYYACGFALLPCPSLLHHCRHDEPVVRSGNTSYDLSRWPAFQRDQEENVKQASPYLCNIEHNDVYGPDVLGYRTDLVVVILGGHRGLNTLFLAPHARRLVSVESSVERFSAVVDMVNFFNLTNVVPLHASVVGSKASGECPFEMTRSPLFLTPSQLVWNLGLGKVDLFEVDMEFLSVDALADVTELDATCVKIWCHNPECLKTTFRVMAFKYEMVIKDGLPQTKWWTQGENTRLAGYAGHSEPILDALGKRNDIVVVDLGANYGMVSQYFVAHARKVVSVEPVPLHFEALNNMNKMLGITNLFPVNVAVGPRREKQTFFIDTTNPTASRFNSTAKEIAARYEPIVVQVVTLAELFQSQGLTRVDLLKVDVEGAEMDLLADIAKLDIGCIHLECHLAECPAYAERVLSPRFSLAKLGSHHGETHEVTEAWWLVNFQWCRKPGVA